MKYLFFFNGQLLLLCCVCCKIAIQDFVTRLQKKIRKIYGFIDGYTDGIQPVGISQRVENKLRDCATFTDGLKPVGISQRVAKKLRDCATITDGITDGLTHIPKRTHVRHVSVCTNTDGFSDGSKSLAGFSNIFGAHFN
jgi:hypothetical protein